MEPIVYVRGVKMTEADLRDGLREIEIEKARLDQLSLKPGVIARTRLGSYFYVIRRDAGWAAGNKSSNIWHVLYIPKMGNPYFSCWADGWNDYTIIEAP